MRRLNPSVKLTGRQRLKQVGSPVPNGNIDKSMILIDATALVH